MLHNIQTPLGRWLFRRGLNWTNLAQIDVAIVSREEWGNCGFAIYRCLEARTSWMESIYGISVCQKYKLLQRTECTWKWLMGR